MAISLKTIKNIIEAEGFSVKTEKENQGYYVLLEQSTPLGEDWCIEFDFECSIRKLAENIAQALKQEAAYYDVDEEAELWIEQRGRNGVPSSVSAIVHDAEWKETVLGNIFDKIIGENKMNEYRKQQMKARDEAIEYQIESANCAMSYNEIAEAQEHFEKLGKKYGLLREFRENAII